MARKNTVPMSLYVTEDDRNKINAFASKHNFAVTGDLVRKALETYMRDLGEDVDLTIQRGPASRIEQAS